RGIGTIAAGDDLRDPTAGGPTWVDATGVDLYGTGTARIDADTTAWAPRTLHAAHLQDMETARRADALVIRRGPDRAQLLSGISGAVPVCGAVEGGRARLSSRVAALTADAPVRADWNAWADILAAGAPLGGKTTFQGVRRRQPWESVNVERGARRF